MEFKMIIKYLLILCSMFLTCLYSTSYWEICGIGLLCAIAVAFDKLAPLKAERGPNHIETEAKDELTPNNGQLTDHFSTKNESDQYTTPFDDHPKKLTDFGITQEKETPTSSTPEDIGHINNKNQEDFGEKETSEILHGLSDTCDAESLDLEKIENLEKENLQNDDINTSDGDILGTEEACVVTNEKNTKATEEIRPTFLVDKQIADILDNFDEKNDSNEIMTSEGVSATPTTDCIEAFEKPSPVLDGKCYTDYIGDFTVEFETSNNIDINPIADSNDAIEKSPPFLDGQSYTEHMGDSPVEFETLDDIDNIPFVDEVALIKSKQNFHTEATFLLNEFIKNPTETKNLTVKPDLNLVSDLQISDEDSKLKNEQTEELEECFENPEKGEKRNGTIPKKKRNSKFQVFKNRLWNLTSTKKSVSDCEASNSRHVEQPKNPQNVSNQDKISKPKKKRRFNCCRCLPF